MEALKKKKILFVGIIFLIIFLGLSLFLPSKDFAYADYEMFGYDLPEGKSVKIIYHYHIEYISGIYFAYEVIFDKDFYSAVENKNALIASIKNTFIKSGFNIDADVANGKIIAYLAYDSVTDYYVANGINGYEPNQLSEPSKKGFLYNEYTSTFPTKLADLKIEGRWINRGIYKPCVEAGISDEEILLSYVYATPYDKQMIISDADEVSYSATDKLYYHIFEMDVSESNRNITIKQRIPNSNGWYLIAIIIGIVVLSIPITVLIVKKTKERKDGAKANK